MTDTSDGDLGQTGSESFAGRNRPSVADSKAASGEFISSVSSDVMAAIVGGYCSTPFDVLGMHAIALGGEPALSVRTFQPQAVAVSLKRGGYLHPMDRVHPDGFFETILPGEAELFRYQLLISLPAAAGIPVPHQYEIEDPYCYPPVLADHDLQLFTEGTHFRLYEKLGAQIIEHNGVPGVCFAVWAPNAERVSVIGEFNQWDGRRHPMRPRGASGLWEIFLPGLQQGDMYKYEVKTRYLGYTVVKSDPFAFASELRPKTASLMWDLDRYEWHDEEWMVARKQRQRLDGPIAIYEVDLGSWKRAPDPEYGTRWLNYRELAEELVSYANRMGFTHIELLPITEYPYDDSWGYQTTGYYAPTSRYGTPDDFRFFVDRAHQSGLGVIIDWVPAHFPKDAHGLSFFDGTHLYEHADPRMGEHQDWGTLIFNYGRNEVRAFLFSNALFWLDKYHIDGLRVDAVASMLYLDYSRNEGEWIPNEFGGRENLEAVHFLKRFNELTHLNYPDTLTLAEESTAWPMVSRPTYLGGLGFDLKWNMGWMHDTLEYMEKEPIHRRYHQQNLTFSLLYAFTENFVLPFSHDEVVHGKGSLLGKMPGDYWQKFANLRALYGYMYAHPGKKLLFMGGEIGQWNEWNHAWQIDWVLLNFNAHREMQDYVRTLNRLYAAQPPLHEMDFSWKGFQWIDFHDVDNSIVSFLRRARDPDDFIVVIANFTPVPRYGYRVGVPVAGFYRELLNSDWADYGGGNMGNAEGLPSEPTPWQGQPHSILVTVPPLAIVFLKPDQKESPKEPKTDAHRLHDYQRIQEAHYVRPAPLYDDDGELPESYGEIKVTLLPINPYLMYAYWNFDPTQLPGTYFQLSMQAQSTALLRFYDTTSGSPPGYFDVSVDLQARNCYVQLSSPGRSYYVELGMNTKDFVPLARSNVVQTARAWPVGQSGGTAAVAAVPESVGITEAAQGDLTEFAERRFHAGISSK
jgi:1,4-alpha-glucan branching enzyme